MFSSKSNSVVDSIISPDLTLLDDLIDIRHQVMFLGTWAFSGKRRITRHLRLEKMNLKPSIEMDFPPWDCKELKMYSVVRI